MGSTSATDPDPWREQQVRAALARVTERVGRACAEVGRDPQELTVVVVTKTYPAADVRVLHRLGVRDVGENRAQEAAGKAGDCADLDLRWHFVGRLQSNKARSVASFAAMVHSVDRPEVATALGRGARAAGRTLDCLLQVSLDGDPSRGGVGPAEAPALAASVAAEDGLRLRGVMAVAPLRVDPDHAFAVLPVLVDRLRGNHPGLDVVSAGMSGDLEAAVRHGATHLRVGSAILGTRPLLG
jgi:pyridoxal phosphate enzyme (YggS family)